MNLLLLSLLLAQSGNVEIFADRDQTYVRAGTEQGLKVGQELRVVSKEGKALGTAVTLEVWEALARVKLDEPAQAFNGAKRVVVGHGSAPAPEARADRLRDEKPTDEAPQAEADAAGDGELRGRATVIGFWEGKRLTVENKGPTDWHHCKLRLPDNRKYELGDLAHDDSEGIMMFRFESHGATTDAKLDAVQVKCDEGSTRLPLDPSKLPLSL